MFALTLNYYAVYMDAIHRDYYYEHIFTNYLLQLYRQRASLLEAKDFIMN